MSPFTLSNVIPEVSLESMGDFWSRSAKIEAAPLLPLLVSGLRAPDVDILTAAKLRP